MSTATIEATEINPSAGMTLEAKAARRELIAQRVKASKRAQALASSADDTAPRSPRRIPVRGAAFDLVDLEYAD